MGNVNGTDIGDQRLLLLLVRYWGVFLESAENFNSTLSRNKRPTVKIKQEDDDYFERKNFDWKSATKEDLDELQSAIQQKELESLYIRATPPLRRRFNKRRRKYKNASVSTDMWKLSDRSKTLEENPYRVFWKTSTSYNQDYTIGHSSLLWRCNKEVNSVLTKQHRIGSIKKRPARLSNWTFLRIDQKSRKGLGKVRQSPIGAEKHDDGSSSCSCDQCRSVEKMAPNSEEEPRSSYWTSEIIAKESQRPPVYNPEDYALSLKKWGRKAQQMPPLIQSNTSTLDTVSTSKFRNTKDNNKENILTSLPSLESEMTLRQFSSVSELLNKLKMDLQSAFPSFVQEFVGDPVDGVTLLLELLRAVQLSQQQQQQKGPPQVQRRALLDEHACLLCLQHCLRCSDASRRLAASPAGLFTLAVCIMSNVTKSRVLALDLLTKACEAPAGHNAVSDALSTLRLRFGEPVRFRFLVGMLHSAGSVDLLTSGMRFINVYLNTAPNLQQRVYIQAELEQAGFNGETLKKTLPTNSDSVRVELLRWERNYLDVQKLQTETHSLREKVLLLEKRVKILQEEKGILRSLEQCLKERCSELEEEVSIRTTTTSLTKSTAHVKPFNRTEKDEGISSSEQELSQDEEIKKEEETTIDEVIEELRTIAETQKTPKITVENEEKTRTFTKDVSEIEIIPSVILPKPPRRTRSLIHIFLSEEDGKQGFFDEEETDSDTSDSSITATRQYYPYEERNIDEETKKRYPDLKKKIEEEERMKKLSQPIDFKKPRESPFVRRTQRFIPVAVKRSQTFHTQETTKPTPKMGVSGLQDSKRHHYSKKPQSDLQKAQRSRSLDRVNNEIVIESIDIDKPPRNIGPRTRRSLAESSIFSIKPQPAIRSSLSSSTPLHLPVEITIQRTQPRKSFFKGSKSSSYPEDTRYPPDGSSSPLNYRPDEAIYATPQKLSKLQKFFGNPKFENSTGINETSEKYFESHYAAPQRNLRSLLQPQNSFYLGQPPLVRKNGSPAPSVYSASNHSGKVTDSLSGLY